MQSLVISTLSNMLDSTPINPTREQCFLAHLICKNLTDLCETGISILNNTKIKAPKNVMITLPNIDVMTQCRYILNNFYTDKMFKTDDEYGNLPIWEEINKFPREKQLTACKIYRCLKENILDKPDSKLLQSAIKKRNKEYFIKNFDNIFANIPFQTYLNQFKNFISTDYVKKDDQELIWEFFDSLIDILMGEVENLNQLKNIK